MLIRRLHQLPPSRDPRQLLQQQPPLATTAETQLTHQLLIPGPMPGRALNQPQYLSIRLGVRVCAISLRAYRAATNSAQYAGKPNDLEND